MERIQEKVRDLASNALNNDNEETKRENAIRILQDIGRDLIANYKIIIDDTVIDPLWVEAYYYLGNSKKEDEENDYQNVSFFADPFVHGVFDQIGEDNFGKLYLHHKTDDSRSGVDICLPINNNFYLSYLLKYTLVNGQYTTQSQLSGKIRTKYEEWEQRCKRNKCKTEPILIKNACDEESIVAFTSRVFPEVKKTDQFYEKKMMFYDLPLAIVKNPHRQYDSKVSLPKKESLVKNYLENKYSSKEEQAKYCKKYLGYILEDFK